MGEINVAVMCCSVNLSCFVPRRVDRRTLEVALGRWFKDR